MQKQIIDFLRKNYITLSVALVFILLLFNILLNQTLGPGRSQAGSSDEPFNDAPSTTINDQGERGATNQLPGELAREGQTEFNSFYDTFPWSTVDYEAILLPLTEDEPPRIMVIAKSTGGERFFLNDLANASPPYGLHILLDDETIILGDGDYHADYEAE